MKRKKVLIVDDDIDMLNLIDFTLTRNGYITQVSLDGSDALKKVDDFKPDAIVLDLMMPDMNGWRLCQWLKNNGDHWIRHIPVIILSAKSDTTDRLDGLIIGADDYMAKPFDIRELTLRLERLLERWNVTRT